MMRARFLTLAVLLMPFAAHAADDTNADGAAVYKRCAACHLPTGAGVPGAYPPLGKDVAGFAARAEGRRYLVLAVAKGLTGPITAEGKVFHGVMPAQAGLNDAQIAAVLNHVVHTIAPGGAGAKSFTAAEVAEHRAAGGTLTAAGVGQMNAGLTAK